MGPVSSRCSVHPWCVVLPPQLGHVSAPCPCPFCGTLSHQDHDYRDMDIICHQDLVKQELPVTGSAQAPSWVVTSAPSLSVFPPCFYAASGLFLLLVSEFLSHSTRVTPVVIAPGVLWAVVPQA